MSDITLKDIADSVGVSIVTVSNALSGKKGVSDSVRNRVVKTAEAMGYDFGKYRQKEKGLRIGVIVSDMYLEIGVSFYWAMYQQVACAASKNQGVTVLEVLGRDPEERRRLPRMIQEDTIDGLIIIGWMAREYIDYLVSSVKIPVVLLDFAVRGLKCDSVMSGNFVGMYKMTRYLVEKGHRDIAYVGSILANENIMDRYYGYRKGLEEAGIDLREEWILEDRDINTGEVHVELPKTMPTAFVCNSDLTAGYLYEELSKKNYRVPEDISIVGYDNYLFGNSFADKITTYNVDMHQMASQAVKLLVEKIRGKEKYYGIRYVDGAVVERSSVKTLK